MSDNLIIIGLRGVGKSTCSKLLAKELKLEFVDTDEMILESYPNASIGYVHNLLGEEKFRLIESEVVSSLKGSRKSVVSTGGGAILCEKNCKIFRSLGRFVCFHLGKKELLERWKLRPPYIPEIKSFDDWYDFRFAQLKKLNPIWVNPINKDWMETLLEGIK